MTQLSGQLTPPTACRQIGNIYLRKQEARDVEDLPVWLYAAVQKLSQSIVNSRIAVIYLAIYREPP